MESLRHPKSFVGTWTSKNWDEGINASKTYHAVLTHFKTVGLLWSFWLMFLDFVIFSSFSLIFVQICPFFLGGGEVPYPLASPLAYASKRN